MKKTALTLAAIAAMALTINAQNPLAIFGINSPIPVSYIPAAFMANQQPGIATIALDPDSPDNSQISILNNTFGTIGTMALPYSNVNINRVREMYDDSTGTWRAIDNTNDDAVVLPTVMPYIEISNSGINALSVIAISQTLFNTDEDFEYIMPVTRAGQADTNYDSNDDYQQVWVEGHWEDNSYWEDGYLGGDSVWVDGHYVNDSTWVDGYWDYEWVSYQYRDISTRLEATAFNIVKANGTVVRTINLPQGYTALGQSDDVTMFPIALIKMMDSYYLAIPAMHTAPSTDPTGQQLSDYMPELLVYSVSAAAGIARVDTELPINVFPTFVNRGNDITVDLGRNSQASTVSVVNSLGQTVKTVNVRPGQHEVKINTGNLGSGINFINATNGQASGTYKIVVR